MANSIFSASFAQPSAYVASSTATGFNASAIGDLLHPFTQWRCGAVISTADYVGIDLGVATLIKAVVVPWVNVTSVKVQSSASNTFSSPTTNLTVSVSLDQVDGRYKFFTLINGGTGTSARYWRILANTSSTTDGGPAMRCGGFAALTAYTTLTTNPGFPLVRRSNQAANVLPIAGGGREASKLGERYASIAFTSTAWPKTAQAEQDFFLMAGSTGMHQPCVVSLEDGDTSHVYICRRTEDVELSQPGPGHYQFGNLAFEEC